MIRSDMNRVSRLMTPVAFALVAVGITFLVDASQPDPVMARVVDTHVIGMDGRISADIEWVTERGATRSAAFVLVPDAYRGMDVVPLVGHEDGALEVSDGSFRPSVYVAAGIIAMALGLAVDLSLRGFGYVRGTVQVGDTPDMHVNE
jgi:hypothetical protein